VLVVLFIALAIFADNFLTLENLLNILRNISIQGVIALGMTMVIIAGEIDLSVGSMVAFAGCVLAWVVQRMSQAQHPLSPVIQVIAGSIAALACSTLVGWIGGGMRVRFAVPTFISSLAWFLILRGAAMKITNDFPISPFPEWFGFLGSGYLFKIPFPAVLFLATFLLVHFIMNHTPFGRAVYAVGGNAEAARLSGIRVSRVKIIVMAIVAMLAAFAGILQASQIQSGSASTATGWELDVISAVIIGGTSLAGGAGSVWGTLIGLVFVGVLTNGMTLLDISESWQMIVRGGLILIAVMINMAPASRRG
jgi:ribose/xylose/arabinose/galactoside ABC-type transport system permease subunit